MSLLEAFNKTKQSFDPKKDKINSSYEELPKGEYTVAIENVLHFVSKNGSGYEDMRFQMKVIDGEYAGRSEFVSINLAETKGNGDPLPQFVIDKNMKTLITMTSLLGVTVTDEMIMGNVTDVYERLIKVFLTKRGMIIDMKITLTNNKKDPDNPYRNYEFSEHKSDPFQSQSNNDSIDVSDDDMPF